METNKHTFEERRFLNKGIYHSLAAISCTFGVDQKALDEGTWGAFKTSFSISDYNRVITLDLDFGDGEDLENSLFKIKQIEEVCKNFRKHLEKMKPLVKQFEEIKNKKEEDVISKA